MAFDTTIVMKYINGLKKVVENGKFGDALLGAMKSGNGLMQQRIFTSNEDVEGNSFGTYIGKRTALGIEAQRRLLEKAKSPVQRARVRRAAAPLTPYMRKRVLRGRQVARKDLELEGDLRRSIQEFIENDKEVVLAFNTDQSALIAAGQEQQITNIRKGRPGTTKGSDAIKIFAFNEDETNEVIEQGIENVLEVLK